jgi:hypothetical protein
MDAALATDVASMADADFTVDVAATAAVDTMADAVVTGGAVVTEDMVHGLDTVVVAPGTAADDLADMLAEHTDMLGADTPVDLAAVDTLQAADSTVAVVVAAADSTAVVVVMVVAAVTGNRGQS